MLHPLSSGLVALLLLLPVACDSGISPQPVDRARVDALFAAFDGEDWQAKVDASRELGEIASYDDEVLNRLAGLMSSSTHTPWVRRAGLEVEETRPRMLSALLTTCLDPNVSYDGLRGVSILLDDYGDEIGELARDRESMTEGERRTLAEFLEMGRHHPGLIDAVVGEPIRVEDPPLHVFVFSEPKDFGRPSQRKSSWANLPGIPLGDPAVPVTVRDAATGEMLSPFRAAVYAPDTWEIRKEARAGDMLLVYHRGYDLFLKELAGNEDRVAVELELATDCGSIKAPAKAGDDLCVTVFMSRRKPDGNGRILRDVFEIELDENGTAELPIPAGVDRAQVIVEHRAGGMVWPMNSSLGAGGLLRLEVDPLDGFLLRSRGTVEGLAASIDRNVDPAWPPERIDALRTLAGAGRTEPLAWRTEVGARVARVPATGWHIFARVDGRRCYLTLLPGQLEGVLPGAAEKPVMGRPVIDGKPVPDMTILAPGALDLDTIRKIGHRDSRAAGYSFAVHRRADWSKVRLANADKLTAWHPDFGVAWLDWSEDTVPSGASLPGRLTLRTVEGEKLNGAVRLRPAWEARGRIITHSFEAPPCQQELKGVSRHHFGGLPPGRYKLSGELNGRTVSRVVEIDGQEVVVAPW